MQSNLQVIGMAFVVAGAALSAGGCGSESAAPRIAQPAVAAVAEPERWFDLGRAEPKPLAVQPGGQRTLVQAGCEAILYDVETRERLHRWNESFQSVVYSRDGRSLLTVQDDKVTVWDGDSGAEIRRFEGRPPAWNELNYMSQNTIAALSDDGRLVAVGNRRGSFSTELPDGVCLYDTHAGQLRQTLIRAEKSDVRSLRFMPGGQRLLAGYYTWGENQPYRGTHILWDTEQGKKIAELPGDVCCESPDGRWIATSGWSRSTGLVLWDADSGREVQTFDRGSALRDFTFRPDAKRILAALAVEHLRDGKKTVEGRLIEWDAASGAILFEGDASQEPYAKVAYSPDGGRRFACIESPNGVDDDVDHFLVGWDATTGNRLAIETYRFASYNGAEELFFYPKGDRFIDLAANFEVRDVLTGKQLVTLPEYRVRADEVAFMPRKSVFLAGDGCSLADYGPNAFLADYLSGKRRSIEMRGKWATFLDGGRALFTCDSITGPCLIDVATGKIARRMPPIECYERRLAVAVSRDAKHLALSHNVSPETPSPSRLILIDVSRPFDPLILERCATALAFHPAGNHIIVGSAEAIEELDTENGRSVRTLSSSPGRPISIAFSDDGKKVLACGVVAHTDLREPIDSSDQGWAILWRADSGQAILLKGHAGPVTTAAFSPDGTCCVTGSMDRTIRLWDASAGRPLHVFRGHLGPIHDVAYSPLGDRVVSAAEDGAAIWNVAPLADPTIDAAPLADDCTTTESSLVENVPATHDAAAVWTSMSGVATWPIVEFTRADHKRLPWQIQDWLSQTSVLEQSGEVVPPASGFGQRRVIFSQSERKMILEDENGNRIRAWDAAGDCMERYLSPSEKEVVVSREVVSGRERWCELAVYGVSTGERSRVIREEDPDFHGHFRIDPRERTILLRMNKGRLVVRDYRTGEKLGSCERSETVGMGGAAYSQNGRYLVRWGTPSTTIKLHDPKTLALERSLANLLPVYNFATSPDEKRLVAEQLWSDNCRLLTMWDIASGRRLWSRVGPAATSSEFSRDGRRLLSCHSQHDCFLAVLWDADTGEVLCAVITLGDTDDYKPVLGEDGRSIHLAAPRGPRLWPKR